MSLKAKIEAVVYAAEEPVTLAQLVQVFADEIAEGLENGGLRESERLEIDGQPERELPTAALDSLPELLPDPPAAEAAPAVEGPGPEAGFALRSEDLAPAAEADARKAARQRERKAREVIAGILSELIGDYSESPRGMEIREIAGGYRMATKPEYHDAVRSFVKSLKPPMKLSLKALETLAVIAYKQPITAPEIGEIRGVDTGGVLAGLIGRKLVTTAGRKQVIGRPILYKTTKEFLLRFGLKDLNELPSMEEFETMAGELEEQASEAPPAPPLFTEAEAAPEPTSPAGGAASEAGEMPLSTEAAAELEESRQGES
jgi:segregation and condensation protein B